MTRFRRFIFCVTFCFSLVVFRGIPAAAQSTTASLGGSVTDASGAAIPEALVTARNVDTGFTQTTSTDGSGGFLFSRLPIGNYELRCEKSGFSMYQQTGLRLTVNQAASQLITMQVGQVAERVTVEANAELVTTRTGAVGQLISERQVVELPLNGRLAQSLVFLAAGTVDLGRNGCRICGHGGVYPGEQTAGVNGAGMGQVNYQLDGAGHNVSECERSVPEPGCRAGVQSGVNELHR